MPPGDGTPEDDFPLLVQQAVFGYVRGQILFSLIMGASAAVACGSSALLGIFPDGERYAVFFGGFYGLMEFIPYIGPIIGPGRRCSWPCSTTRSARSGWCSCSSRYSSSRASRGPQVFRISLRINPILIILSLLIGYQLYGIAGALVALPIAAVIRQTVIYLRRHLVFEPWAVGAPAAACYRRGPDRCPDCGAAPARRRVLPVVRGLAGAARADAPLTVTASWSSDLDAARTRILIVLRVMQRRENRAATSRFQLGRIIGVFR